MTVTIDVTADDISAGQPHTCIGCPVALALSRKAGQEMVVGYSTARNRTHSLRGSLPICAQKFISAFDRGDSVSPITFQVKLAATPVFVLE